MVSMEMERPASPKAQPAPALALPKDAPVSSLLKVAQGSLLSSLAYSRAVEAAVTAAKRGIANEHASEWRDATVRLLQSRSNSPLALLWAFVAFQKRILESESGNVPGSLVSGAQSLLHSLKFMTAGFCSGPTAIAAAAPVVQIVVSSLVVALANTKDAPTLSQKRNEKLWRTLQKVIMELSGFITLCHHKDAPVAHGLFKTPSVNLGLHIWLSEDSDFPSLFPFATQLKVDGFLNSIESVLYLGEIVETEVALLRLVVEIIQGRSSSNKEELEKKLKHNVILYSKFLGSSTVILDMLLDPPLQLGGILEDGEELLLRNVLGEMAVVAVLNSEMFDEDRSVLSAGDTVGKDRVAFLKRIILARQLAATFRSRNEYLRASDLLAGLHRRGAPASLGEWLGGRSFLRLVISTAVLQKPQALLDWLLNASNADFNLVLDKAYIERPKTNKLEDVPSMDLEEAEESDTTSLFFIDTSKTHGNDTAEEAGFDADQAYLMAAGDMQVATKDDVLFHRSEQLERKRTRGGVRTKATKAKQRKDSNGGQVKEDITNSEHLSMSEDDESEDDDSQMSE